MKTMAGRVLVLVCGAAGCGSPPFRGDPCTQPPTSPVDPQVVRVLATAAGHHNIDGTWLNGRQAAVLEVDLNVGSPQRASTTGCGGVFLLDATARVKTRDGVADGVGQTLHMNDPWSAWIEVPLPDLAEDYAHPGPSFPPIPDPNRSVTGRRPSRVVPTMILEFVDRGWTATLFVDGARVVGLWTWAPAEVPWRLAPRHVVPAELVAECAPAADFTDAVGQYTPFASAAEASTAMIGTWIRCRPSGGPPHDGLQISPEATWRTLSWRDGALVWQGGFQQEGVVEAPIDLSTPDQRGRFQVNLSGPNVWLPARLWAGRLIVSTSSTSPLDETQDVYVRTTRLVQPVNLPFVSQERAGTAACAQPETGALELPTGDALQRSIAGAWTLCTGELLDGFTGLRFDGPGLVTLLGPGGVSLRTQSYETIRPVSVPDTPFRNVLLFRDRETDWTVTLSERPLKLWLLEEGPYTTPRKAVFSALP